MYYGRDVGVIPLTDANWISKPFSWPSHKGVDIGWSDKYRKYEHCPVLAWQDGVVVDKGYGTQIGNYIVVEHIYEEGKRWTGYIHLADSPTVKVGDKVTLGKQMGNARRGNTGKSNGTHLHLYLTGIVDLNVKYSWEMMLLHSVNPVPYLYYSKEYNTVFIDKEYWKKELVMITYPKPVERNEKVEQCQIKSDTRRLRKNPSINAEAYPEFCKRGIYNVYGWTKADNYDWALIGDINGNKFYVAVMEGEKLEVVDYEKLYETEKAKNTALAKELARANTKLNQIKAIVNQ